MVEVGPGATFVVAVFGPLFGAGVPVGLLELECMLALGVLVEMAVVVLLLALESRSELMLSARLLVLE